MNEKNSPKVSHTPGPWIYDGQSILIGNTRHMLRADGVGFSKPDARLIAAAPELFQTIKDIQHNAQVMNQAEPNRVWTAIDDACRAAMAKAEGSDYREHALRAL